MNIHLSALVASEGLLDSAGSPLTLVLVGFGLLVASIVLYTVIKFVDDNDEEFSIRWIMQIISVVLAIGGVVAILIGVFGIDRLSSL